MYVVWDFRLASGLPAVKLSEAKRTNGRETTDVAGRRRAWRDSRRLVFEGDADAEADVTAASEPATLISIATKEQTARNGEPNDTATGLFDI
jgi:hypothetical protein